mmetsp:Transcript_9103/g.11762  ORF Transcript_9103/g.11762 Transcript_9103/m.11762 type:complete len:352 (+) Transcript_9103:237-1292(+)
MGFICNFFGCRRRNIHVLSRDDVYDTETDDEAIESSSLRENLIDPEQTPELSLEESQCRLLQKALIKDGYPPERLTDGRMILRHYRASKGDMNKALQSIKDTIEWREGQPFQYYPTLFDDEENTENEVVNELRSFMRYENETGKVYARSYDKDGRCALMLYPSRENSSKAFDNLRHLIYNIERAIKCSERRSLGTVDSITFIICFNGYSGSKAPSLSVTRECISILQNHYPERLHKAYMINAPSVFNLLWNLARPFIDNVTRSKIQFLRGTKAMEVLSEAFDLRYLEEDIYGSATRPFDSVEYLHTPFHTAFGENDVNGQPAAGESAVGSDTFYDAFSKHSIFSAGLRSIS